MVGGVSQLSQYGLLLEPRTPPSGEPDGRTGASAAPLSLTLYLRQALPGIELEAPGRRERSGSMPPKS